MSLHRIGEQALSEGRNITAALREHLGVDRNTPEIVEIAYDLQAGTYVSFAEEHPDYIRSYSGQLARMLDPHLKPGDVLLDAGAGELTTLSHMVAQLTTPLSTVYATDISEKRLEIGKKYAARYMKNADLRVMRAELSSIPLPSSSVDVVTTNHALEPNGGREGEIIAELVRVARRKLVLFEPCYEIASPAGKARMESLGYIRGLPDLADSVTSLEIVDNPLNPTACFVISV
jgi:SAM-dependent methyltransferase